MVESGKCPERTEERKVNKKKIGQKYKTTFFERFLQMHFGVPAVGRPVIGDVGLPYDVVVQEIGLHRPCVPKWNGVGAVHLRREQSEQREQREQRDIEEDQGEIRTLDRAQYLYVQHTPLT